ncbi:hypothetical protein QT381_06490 [Galbitalea sp. SE-J8]|uniref:hypothetical protein n=1 Tax=Galbitalea sp. SE-J8 TaxID=3054952 RepID=UPI00259CFD4F|nr:hypothetical protein [Galbitalea sp. SE-J8]MDM4762651.1 hypothetical protein [Galbitalea sp. SE-J8]
MTIPRYDDTIDSPLRTGENILDRVHDLIGPACRAQTWFLFVDDDDVQLPLLIPIDDVPEDAAVDATGAAMASLCDAAGAAAMIVVIESPGTHELTDADRAWARVVRDAALAVDVELRALLLSHDHGVRALAPDDLL